MMSPGDSDLDQLKQAMESATPRPDAARKAEVLARAQAKFEATQESLARARPNSDRPNARGIFRGVIDMLKTHSIGALTGTTALVAIGFLVLSPAGQEILRAPQAPLAPQSAVEPIPTPLTTNPEGPAPLPQEAVGTPASVAPPARTVPAPGPAPRIRPADDPGAGTLQLGRLNESPELGDFSESEADVSAPAITGLLDSVVGGPGIAVREAPADRTAISAPNTEDFASAEASPLRVVAENPVSTFSIDVDTASYALIRSMLSRGQVPPADAVRIEEMVNYFAYDLPAPEAGDVSPFRPTIEVFDTPWNPDTQLVHIGIQGELPAIEDRPPLNLVFLIDTSGSMNEPTKLPLLIQSFRLMLDRLRPEDEVAIVTYAGAAGVVLEPTPASDTSAISAAMGALQAGGSTNGVGGLEAAYDLAAEMTEEGEISRVLLATDGDFNVGLSDPGALEDYIATEREGGTYLSVLGFGRGNLQDDTMQALAQTGNGTAAYIDTLHEAQRVLVDQLAGALFPIADDLKVQVEFNPEVIAEYRLIGYETRALAREDFANDAVDAGELGAGHSVVALYEVTPVGSPATLVAPLRYAADADEPAAFADELGFLSLRWKAPGAETSQLLEVAIPATPTDPSTEAQFAAAIAGFGQLLRSGAFLGDWGYDEAIALANATRGADPFGDRREAVQLMRLAESLSE